MFYISGILTFFYFGVMSSTMTSPHKRMKCKTIYFTKFPRMSRVSSFVIVRVAALVAFLTTFSFAVVRDLVVLPETLLLT